MSKCPEIDLLTDASKTREQVRYFATNQRIFAYRDLHETMALFARHFQHERLQHGLHGLYAIHKDYCPVIAAMLETFGYSLIVSAVHTNPGALSDSCKFLSFFNRNIFANIFSLNLLLTVVDWLWPSICEMFSPWLFPYYTQNLPNLPANWIRQFNTPILVPWSEFYGQYAQQLLHSFAGCIQLLLDTFPACDLILGYIFYWYETNYGNVTVPRHIIQPMNNVLMQLPWNRMKPTPTNISGFYRMLQQVSKPLRYLVLNCRFNLISNFIFISKSICPNAIHCWVLYSCGSRGHRGCNAISISGTLQRDHKCFLRCC